MILVIGNNFAGPHRTLVCNDRIDRHCDPFEWIAVRAGLFDDETEMVLLLKTR